MQIAPDPVAFRVLRPDQPEPRPAQINGLFGQCFGAVVAFELAQRLSTMDKVKLVHLFASGSQSPWGRGPSWAGGVDDDELIRRVQGDIGYAHDALAVPQLRELAAATAAPS